MTNTTNYELNIVEGTDKVNPLTQLNPNFEIIDEQMKKNSDAGVQSATELTTGTVHALTRLQGDAPVFRFTATSKFTAGDTFTVDGVQVSALTTSGEQLPDGAYVIGAEVLCNLKGSVLTVYFSMNTVGNATNAQKLNGQNADYYATSEEVEQAQETATSAGNLAAQNAEKLTKIGVVTLARDWYSEHDTTGDITLSDNIDNYDLIIVNEGYLGSGSIDTTILPTERFKLSTLGNPIQITNGGTGYYVNNTTLKWTPVNNMHVDVYGVRLH